MIGPGIYSPHPHTRSIAIGYLVESRAPLSPPSPKAWIVDFLFMQIAEFKGRVYYAQDLMAGARYGGISLAVLAGVLAIIFFGFGWRRKRNADLVSRACM